MSNSAVMSAASSSSHTAAPQTNPPVRKLYRHALESIFAFATLSELHHINSVSHEWGAAVQSLPSIGALGRVNYRDGLLRLCSGSLRRHVCSLMTSNGQRYVVGLKTVDDFPFVAAHCATSLTDLRTIVGINSPEQAQAACSALQRFQKLRELRIDGITNQGPRNSAALGAASNRIVETVGRLNPAAMHTLELRLPWSADLSFAPLFALTHLRDLTFGFDDEGNELPLTDKLIDQLRVLSSVTHLHAPYISAASSAFLTRMLQPGHALCWTRLGACPGWTRIDDGYLVRVDDSLAAVIGSLHTLAVFVASLRCTDLRFFSDLRAISEVKLLALTRIDSAALVRSLSDCTQIRSMRLERFDLTGDQLTVLLAALPLLSTCFLRRFSRLDSLRGFCTPSLGASLTNLNLTALPFCPPAEVAHLFELRSLTSLRIDELSAPLSADHAAEFRVQSVRFPALRVVSIY